MMLMYNDEAQCYIVTKRLTVASLYQMISGGGGGVSDGAMVLGKLPVNYNFDYSRARAYCACIR